jgi:hypothetical protein
MVILAGVLLMLGCGKNPTVPDGIAYIGGITPEATSIVLGRTQQFNVVVTKEGISSSIPPSVTWRVVGGIGTIDATGLFYATTAGQGSVEAAVNSLVRSARVTVIDVNKNLSQAQSRLEAGDIDGAHQNYLTVLNAAPDNSEANFGEALIGVLNVAIDSNTGTLLKKHKLINYKMPSTLNELFAPLITGEAKAHSIVNFSAFAQAATTPEVIPSEIQSYIKNTLLPPLDTALARLATIESDKNFKYVINKKLGRLAKDRELDLGEIYLLDVVGSLFKGIFHDLLAYNWNYSTTSPLSEESFATLKLDGKENMELARISFIRAMAKQIDGINHIDAETDDQADDLIPKFNKQADKDALLKYLGLIKNSLENGNTIVEISPTKSLVVNLKRYYVSPVSDWKPYINGVKNNFPAGYDFTLNGVLPDMTSRAAWDKFLQSR